MAAACRVEREFGFLHSSRVNSNVFRQKKKKEEKCHDQQSEYFNERFEIFVKYVA